MTAPKPKKPISRPIRENDHQRGERPRLTVIEGGPLAANHSRPVSPAQDPDTRSAPPAGGPGSLLGALALASALALYVSLSRPEPADLTAYYQLHSPASAGSHSFAEAKRTLEAHILRGLRDTNPAAVREARNIAVYLFPDLLPESDFERFEARQLWLPHQRAIEAAPHTLESRMHFEQMRANVWNYETADRSAPRLSRIAAQMLRVYERLSTTR